MIVYDHPTLSPTDKIIYAVVYWYEHMRDGICKAGNPSIAGVAKVDERTVRVGLERLEAAGFIKREYKNETRKQRLQIKCLVRFGLTQETQPSMKAKKEKKQLALIEVPVEEREDTPGEYARKFFTGDKDIVGSLGKQLEDSGIPGQMVVRELLKFKAYWTEPTKSGKKEKWELQQTFDVKRRLGTWFRNIAERQQSGGSRRAGAGVTV